MWVAPQRESAQFTQAHHHRHSNFQAIERGVGVAGVRGRDGHPSSVAVAPAPLGQEAVAAAGKGRDSPAPSSPHVA